jgi:hypothetical protein
MSTGQVDFQRLRERESVQRFSIAPIAVLLLGLVGCDVNNEPQEREPPTPTTEAIPIWPEASEPEVARATEPSHTPADDPVSGIANGRWLAGAPGANPHLIEVDGTLATVTDLSATDTQSTLFELVNSQGRRLEFRIATEGRIETVYAYFPTDDESLVWSASEGDLLHLRHVVPMPEALIGEWEVLFGSSEPTGQTLIIDAETMRFASEPVGHGARIFALASRSDDFEIAAIDQTSGSADITSFRALAPDVYVTREPGTNEISILYRAGQRPDWLGPGEPSATVPTTRPTSRPTTEQSGSLEVEESNVEMGADVRRDLQTLAFQATLYWDTIASTGAEPRFPESTGWTPESDECGSLFDIPEQWAQASWEALEFVPSMPHGYQYRFLSSEASGDYLFEVQARRDADCDGVYNKLTIEGLAAEGSDVELSAIVEDNPGE